MTAYKSNEYTHYLTGETAAWKDVFWSEAQMLWMQRNPGDINGRKEMGKGIPDMKQPKSLKKLINSKRRKGLAFYPYGIEITIPKHRNRRSQEAGLPWCV